MHVLFYDTLKANTSKVLREESDMSVCIRDANTVFCVIYVEVVKSSVSTLFADSGISGFCFSNAATNTIISSIIRARISKYGGT